MTEDQFKEYKIRTSYTEIITLEEETTRIIEAQSAEEAMEMIERALYREHDEIDDISHDILEVKSCEPGHRDDKTVDMFKEEKEILCPKQK